MRNNKRINYDKLKRDLKIKSIEKGDKFVKLLKEYGITPQALHLKNNKSFGSKEFVEKLEKLCEYLGIDLNDYVYYYDEMIQLKPEHKDVLGKQLYYYYKNKKNGLIAKSVLLDKLEKQGQQKK